MVSEMRRNQQGGSLWQSGEPHGALAQMEEHPSLRGQMRIRSPRAPRGQGSYYHVMKLTLTAAGLCIPLQVRSLPSLP